MAGAAARRRPLALLAFVAAAGDAGVSRELALARFWPDSDEAKARNNLKQAVFGLRRDLGDVFATSAATLRIDRSAIAVDALEFNEAMQRDDPDAAVAIYRGPFLDGFTIPGLDEFERWSEETRQRYAGNCHRALESIAERARRAGDLAAAVEAWRRRTSMDPLSGRATAGLMRALRDVGDHTAALDLLRVHEVLVRDELGAAPDPALVALAAEIRRGFSVPPASTPRPATSPAPVPTPTTATLAVSDAPVVASAVAAPALVRPVTPMPARSRFAELWDRHIASQLATVPRPRELAMLAVALIAPVLTWRLAARPLSSEPLGAVGAPSLVAVLPFAVRGDADDPVRLGAGVADLVAVALNGADPFRTIPPSVIAPRSDATARDGFSPARARALAKDVGAAEYVTGEIVRDGRRLHVIAALHAGDAVTASAAADGAADEIGETVGRLVLALIAQRLSGPGDALAHAAATSTHSLPALKAWLAAERDYDDQRYGDAVAGFRRATVLDSGFALAYYRMANASDAEGSPSESADAVAMAVRFGDALPTSIRELVTAWRDWRSGEIDEAETRLEAIVEEEPDNVEAWLRLAELRFRDNPTRGRSARGARSAFERVLTLEPSNAEALLYLARIASLERKVPEARTYAQRARDGAVDVRLVGLRAVRTFALGDGVEPEDALRTRVTGVTDGTAIDVALHGDDAQAIVAFTRALLASASSAESRVLAYRLTAIVAASHARWQVTSSALDSVSSADRDAGAIMRGVLVSQPFFSASDADLRRAATMLAGPARSSRDAAGRLHAMGLVAAARNDDASLARAMSALRGLPRAEGRALGASLAARAAEREGRLTNALAALDSARTLSSDARYGLAETADRYLRAELLHRLGRDDEATGWYASIAERASFELPWLAPAELRLGEIQEKRGERAGARQHYLRFLTLWQECDPPYRATTADAARALARTGESPAPR